MQHKLAWRLAVLAVAGTVTMGGCVVAPPRARVAVVAPVRVWVPGYRAYGHVWVNGYWRYH